MRRIVVAGTLMLVALLISALPAGAQTDGASIAKTLIDAENNRDIEGAVALFTDDAVVVDPGGRYATRAEIRQWQTGLSQIAFRANVNAPTVAGTRVTFTGDVANDRLRGLGLDKLDGSWELTVEAGKIKVFTFSFTAEANARLQQALARAQVPAQPLAATGGNLRPGVVVAGLSVMVGALLVRAAARREGAV